MINSIPINGGVQTVQTSLTQARVLDLSQQYIKANSLESRPTEWVLGGRPIYRRLPATSQTYQVDFFNLVPVPNTAVSIDEVKEIGYVYIPWGDGLQGPTSLEVVSSNSNGDLMIKAGVITWKYGTNTVPPAIINLQTLDVRSGRYFLGYQLVYDDSPVSHLYLVENFSLVGQPLEITSSTDSVVGWRYPAVNAFRNADGIFWKNSDSFFPNSSTYSVQPTTASLSWLSNQPSAYSNITLRCPPSSVFTGAASLYYVNNSVETFVSTVSVSTDYAGQFFSFNMDSPSYNNGWKVVWSDLDIAIQSVVVNGVVTKTTKPSGPQTSSALVLYPENAVPTNTTYCPLAFVDINSSFKVIDIQDIRYIVHKNYAPIANWLTVSFDETLIDLYEQVKSYSPLWMAPPTCMKQEYLGLTKDTIIVQN